jgi:hypothetical protein
MAMAHIVVIVQPLKSSPSSLHGSYCHHMAIVTVAICAITSPSLLCGRHIGVVDVAMGSRCSGHR